MNAGATARVISTILGAGIGVGALLAWRGETTDSASASAHASAHATEASPLVADVSRPIGRSADTAFELHVCPRLTVTNAPPLEGSRIRRDSATGCLNGVYLRVAPAPGACLSSGFGYRRSRMHRGIDLHRRPATHVVAAAPGVIVEAGFRTQDFGHWVAIDHGAGVYSAYAHLARRGPEIQRGARVGAGQPIGLMGSSGRATSAVHLHYEVRVGDLRDRGWFGLEAVDPLALPTRCS